MAEYQKLIVENDSIYSAKQKSGDTITVDSLRKPASLLIPEN